MGSDFIQNVFLSIFAADFRGQIIQPAAEQMELLQRGQQGFERSKRAKAETAGQVERLKR